jgi:hypothetical protein
MTQPTQSVEFNLFVLVVLFEQVDKRFWRLVISETCKQINERNFSISRMSKLRVTFRETSRDFSTSLGMTSECNVTLLAEMQPIHERRKIALSGAK